MTGPDDERTVRELRASLSDRIGTLPPPTGVYDAVRRRHRRGLTVLVAGTAVAAAVAIGVPAVALGRGQRAPSPTATPPPAACTAEPGPDAPGLRPQGTVAGSLGGDRAAVTAVLRVGWERLRKETGRGTPLDPATARVRMVQRTADGVLVGVVAATGSVRGLAPGVFVIGPRLDRLSTERIDSLDTAPGDDALRAEIIAAVAEACGHPRVVVVAPRGSTARLTQVTGVRADATMNERIQPVPLRPDGVAVVDRPTAPTARLEVDERRTGQSGGLGGLSVAVGPSKPVPDCVPVTPPGQGCTRFEQAVAAAPGDGDQRSALNELRRPSSLPLTHFDLRVLWRGTTNGGTVTAAATTLPGGAQYVWGGMTTSGLHLPFPFYGLLPAGGLDRTALVFRSPRSQDIPGVMAIFVPGTAQVRATVDGVPRTVTATSGTVLKGKTITGLKVTRADGSSLRTAETYQLPSPFTPELSR